MIDWLINVAYNIGMFILLLLFIFGALIHLKYKAEHTPEGANYAMLQELRKPNQRRDEEEQQKKITQTQQAKVHYLEQKLARLKEEEARINELQRQWIYIQLEAQIAELKRIMEEENVPADILYTALKDEFNAEFWENYAAIKAEYVALNDTNMAAKMDVEKANYKALKQELEAVLFPELTATQTPIASRSTPPPLPPMS